MKHDHGQPFEVVGSDSAASKGTRLHKLIRLIPNLLTLTAVILGLTAIRLSGEGAFALTPQSSRVAALRDKVRAVERTMESQKMAAHAASARTAQPLHPRAQRELA